MVNRILVGLSLALIAAAPMQAQDGKLVFLVRHAEKAAQPAADPPLTAQGQARAQALLGALAGARIDAAIVTQFARTRLTAEPVMRARGLNPIVITAGSGSAHPRAIADAVHALPPGSAVLVIGHSNTIPAIIAELDGPRMPELCDAQYDDLFILELTPGRQARFVHASYGEHDPPGAGECR